MKSKTILSAAAFIVAFAASAAFASLFITKTHTVLPENLPVVSYNSTSCFKYRNNSATADKIAALIRQDRNNGLGSGKPYRIGVDAQPPFTDSGFPYYAAAVERYVEESSSIKVSDLPSDFQAEWHEHLKAWRGYSKFLNNVKDSANRKNLSDEELEEIADLRNSAISSTWQSVLQSGRSYGAKVD